MDSYEIEVDNLSIMLIFFFRISNMDHEFLKEYLTMFSYEDVKQHPEVLLAITSLREPEFKELIPYFQKAWDEYVQQSYIDRLDRKRKFGGGNLESKIASIEDKLLFILYYVKIYPLQEIIAYEFEITQSTSNRLIHILTTVLKNALNNGGHLPERDPHNLEADLKINLEDKYGIDGTERRVVRPKDNKIQKEFYSGKKKAHTLKNVIIGRLTDKTIRYLSQTYEGKRHDKKIIDDEAPVIPKGISLYKDTGFQGYEPEGVITFQPQKKPKGKELTPEQKEENRLISKVRVFIEHIISGVKRCRIVKDIFRNTVYLYDDLVMEVACGLHNFRVHCRHSYSR